MSDRCAGRSPAPCEYKHSDLFALAEFSYSQRVCSSVSVVLFSVDLLGVGVDVGLSRALTFDLGVAAGDEHKLLKNAEALRFGPLSFLSRLELCLFLTFLLSLFCFHEKKKTVPFDLYCSYRLRKNVLPEKHNELSKNSYVKSTSAHALFLSLYVSFSFKLLSC